MTEMEFRILREKDKTAPLSSRKGRHQEESKEASKIKDKGLKNLYNDFLDKIDH
jgi:hypothetical protein